MNERGVPEQNSSFHCNTLKNLNFFPRQFRDPNIRLLKIRAMGKEAVERNWQSTNNYGAHSSVIQEWVQNGGNYGLTCPYGFCCFVDADTEKIQKVLETLLPETFRWSTGRVGHFQYAYYIEDEPVGCIPLRDGSYLKGKGGYALGPGSIHPNGKVYGSREIRDVPIAIAKKDWLLNALKNFMVSATAESWGNQSKTLPIGTAKIEREKIVRILVPYWAQADGRRNDLTLSIAGFIARSGGTEEDAVSVISELCRLTGKGCDHVSGSRYAFHREGKIKGLTSLQEIMEELENGK